MKKYIHSTIKAHIIRSAFYLLLLVAICVIQFALAQRQDGRPPLAGRGIATNSMRHNPVLADSPGPTPTSTPTATPTATHTPTPCGQYWTTAGTLPIVPGSTDTGNHCDNCDTAVTLPFPFSLYGVTYNSVMVSSNGRLDFLCNNEPAGAGGVCLPAGARNCPFDYTIFPYWASFLTDNSGSGCQAWPNGCGVYTSISGTRPNRIFNIEWHTVLFYPSNTPYDFEVRLYENDPNQRFDVIYGAVTSYMTQFWVGGVQGPPGFFTEDFCETGMVPPRTNTSRTYTFVPCASPTATPTVTATPSLTPTCTPSGDKIFNIGGLPGPDSTNRIYDISTNTWTTGAPLPTTLAEHAIAYFNGKIYVAGGYNGSKVVNTLYIYDIASNSWTTGANMPEAVSVAGFGVINGKLYVASGSIGSVEVSTLQVYDIASDSWSVGASVPVAVTGPGSAVIQGQLYLFGGASSFNTTTISQRYDPVTISWSICGNMNLPRAFFYGAAVGNTGIVAPGGENPIANPVNVVEQGGCGWVTRAPLPYSASGPFAVSDGTYVYIGGGDDGSTVHTDTLRYDPVANTYTPLAPAPDPHYLSQAVFVPHPCGTPASTPTATPTGTAITTATPTVTPTTTARPSPTARRLPTPRPRVTPAPRP